MHKVQVAILHLPAADLIVLLFTWLVLSFFGLILVLNYYCFPRCKLLLKDFLGKYFDLKIQEKCFACHVSLKQYTFWKDVVLRPVLQNRSSFNYLSLLYFWKQYCLVFSRRMRKKFKLKAEEKSPIWYGNISLASFLCILLSPDNKCNTCVLLDADILS